MTDKLQQVNTINTIIGMAEAAIFEKVGIKYRLLLVGNLPEDNKTPKEMANVIANCLGLTIDDYSNRSREPRFVHMRHLAAYFIHQYHPKLTLKELGVLTGHGHHTSVMHSIRYTETYSGRMDDFFQIKYEQVLSAITQWLAD